MDALTQRDKAAMMRECLNDHATGLERRERCGIVYDGCPWCPYKVLIEDKRNTMDEQKPAGAPPEQNHIPEKLEEERKVVEMMTAQGWENAPIPALPMHVGRFWRRAGQYEIDIERDVGGFSVALYDCEGPGTFPDLVGDKHRCQDFAVAYVAAGMIRDELTAGTPPAEILRQVADLVRMMDGFADRVAAAAEGVTTYSETTVVEDVLTEEKLGDLLGLLALPNRSETDSLNFASQKAVERTLAATGAEYVKDRGAIGELYGLPVLIDETLADDVCELRDGSGKLVRRFKV